MNFEKIKRSRKSRKLTLTITNPPVNAISRQVISELHAALDMAESDLKVEEVVFTGEGEKYFSAGSDIRELKAVVDSPDPFGAGYEFSRMGQKLMLRILTYPKLTTALIKGYCFGGGFELALACDTREAYTHAWLGFPEVMLGIIPGWGGTQILGWEFDARPATSLVIGTVSSASDEFWKMDRGRWSKVKCAGEEEGTFVNKEFFTKILGSDKSLPKPQTRKRSKVAASSGILVKTFASMQSLAKRKPLCEFLSSGEGKSYFYDLLLKQEAIQFGLLCQHPDVREGINAFLEKREPKFQDL